MLMMRPPIKVQFHKPIDTVYRDMEERIRGNYSLLQGMIRKEELLHVTASSPEIYFEQGNGTNILNEITSQSRQEFRLEVINNLVNRILVSNTDNLTYQDSVYISNVLRKIGITDVNQFMKQILNMQTERKENHKLIRLYEENKQYLSQIMEWEQGERKQKDKKNETVSDVNKETYYLHDSIYKRLETDRIYQDILKFVQGNTSNENRITTLEMNIAEQAALTQVFRLHNLRNEALHKEASLYYFHANSYETISEEEENNESIPSEISSAILTNLVDQIYFLKQESIMQNNHRWYSIASALFETAENTWKRYEWNHTEGMMLYDSLNQNLVYLNEKKEEEIQLLSEIENQYNAWSQEWNRKTMVYESEYLTQNRFDMHREENLTQNEEVSLINNDLQLQYLVSQINEENRERLNELTVEEIKEQIRITNERNLESLRKIQEAQELEKFKPKLKDVRVDKKSAKKHSLRALEAPEEVLKEILQTETVQQISEIHTDEVLHRQSNYETMLYETVEHNLPAERILLKEDGFDADEVIEETPSGAASEIKKLTHEFLSENKQIIREVRNLETIIQQQKVENRLYLPQQKLTYLQPEVFVEEKQQEIRDEMKMMTNEMVHVFHEENENIKNTETRLETEWKDIILHHPQISNQTDYFQTVSLIHKEEEQVITEELLNTVKFQTQQTVREQTVENKTITEDTFVETNVQKMVHQATTQQLAGMEALIQQNVKKQIGQLSDQIYGKLEKKLQTERKRRGY